MTERPRRRKQKTVEFPHGHKRSSDLPSGSGSVDRVRDRMRAPAGTSFLLFLCVAVMVAMGIVRIQSTTAVLEAGGDITKLSEQQAALLEEKRLAFHSSIGGSWDLRYWLVPPLRCQ